MTRIQPVTKETASPAAVKLLTAVEKSSGSIPNLIATMATSPPVAKAYLDFTRTLSGGKLPAKLREQIALAVGEANQCDYCLAAHTLMGKGAGLTDQQTCDARRGESADDGERAAIAFAQRIVNDRGNVADADVQDLRDAGYTDGEITEIVANVAVNIFTNYFNHVAGTEVDFPAAPDLAVA